MASIETKHEEREEEEKEEKKGKKGTRMEEEKERGGKKDMKEEELESSIPSSLGMFPTLIQSWELKQPL